VVQVLLAWKGDVNSRDYDGERHLEEFEPSASGLAVLGGGHFMLSQLSQQHTNLKEPNGQTLLVAEETSAQQYTQRLGTADSTSLKVLQQHGLGTLSQRDVDGSTPAHLAAKQGHVVVDVMVDVTTLWFGFREPFLLQSGVDASCPDDSGHTPLHLAAQEGQMIPFERGPSLLLSSYWASNGHVEVCSVLLLQKANVPGLDWHLTKEKSEYETFIVGGVFWDENQEDRELVELILSWGASVTLADNDGWCPLHEAARWGDGELVESLLLRGADPSARSNDGETGLGEAELAGLLLQSGADANATNTAGATPLDFAKKDEVRWLLRSHKGRKGTGAL
ncbi:Ank3, partial [Symbiodinium pilosum]